MKETILFWALVITLASWTIANALRSFQIWKELRDGGDDEDGGEDVEPDSPHHQIDPDFDPADWWKRRTP